MERFRGQTNAFSVGSGSNVLNLPKEIAEEMGIDNASKKTYFHIYTDYSKKKKRVIYEFFQHAERGDKNEE
jgi:hypothetical protein